LTFFLPGIIFSLVIRGFRNKALRLFFETWNVSGLSVRNAARVGSMLRALDAAARPAQVNLPGFHFHALRGVQRWSIRATANWRITFRWDGNDATDVDLEDYH
jgi:proteic killer suppression protein